MDRKEYKKLKNDERLKKSKLVQVTLSFQEYERLKKLADKKETSVSKTLYQLAIDRLKRAPHIDPDLEQRYIEFNRIMRGVANNLNQLAHSANIFEQVDSTLVFQHLEQMDRIVKAFTDYQTNQDVLE